MIVAMLRIIFVAHGWKFATIPVAPANHKPLVVSPSLAVETRETVWAVLERYGVGNWA